MANANVQGVRLTSVSAARVGRALLGALFLVSGLLKTGRFAGIAAVLATKGVPLPEVVAGLVILLEIAGGLALVIGWRAREAGIALALFVIAATLLFHPFWSADAAAFSNQLNHFLKNVAILGALMMVAASSGHHESA